MKKELLDQLIQKYWEADTSQEEERLLRQSFKHIDQPSLEKDLFSYFESEKTKEIFSAASSQRGSKLINWSWSIMSAAAVILMLIGSYWLIPRASQTTTHDYVTADAEEALETTRMALSLIGEGLSKSNSALELSMSKLNKTIVFH